MPAYASVVGSAVPVLTPGRPIALFNNELVTVNEFSMRFAFHREQNLPNVASLEFQFVDNTGAPLDPGTFEIDFVTADTAVDGDSSATFSKKASVDQTLLSSSKTCRTEITNIVARFGALFIKTFPNFATVYVIAKVF
jgi:hypothetical protein